MHGSDIKIYERYLTILDYCKHPRMNMEIVDETKASAPTLRTDLKLLTHLGYLTREINPRYMKAEYHFYKTAKKIETQKEFIKIRKYFASVEYKDYVIGTKSIKNDPRRNVEKEIKSTNGYVNGVMVVAMRHISAPKKSPKDYPGTSYNLIGW